MGQAENNITKRIKDFLKSKDIWHVKYFANAFTSVGIPDILACVKGLFIGIEVKTDKGIVSEVQKYQGREIQKSGGKWFVVRPSNFDDFKQDIEKMIGEDEMSKVLTSVFNKLQEEQSGYAQLKREHEKNKGEQ